MNLKELTDLAYTIREANDEKVLISGSIGLSIMDVKLRREPKDIDLYLPYGEIFKPIVGMKPYHYETEEDYENIYYERKAYKMGETQIDVFTPCDKEGEVILADEQCESCLARHVIVGFKVQHSMGDSYNRYKHRDDVIHILINN